MDYAYDYCHGGPGDDRFLTRPNDHRADQHSNDVRIRVSNGTSRWTDREVENIDQAFAELQERAGTTRILKDTNASGSLEFVKEAAGVGYAGMNEMWWDFWSFGWKRKIHIADWNEWVDNQNESRRRTVIHEIGHNWDSGSEADSHPHSDDYWDEFQQLHRASSHDNDFARLYGQTNVKEDWCTCLEVAMGYATAGFPDSPSTLLQDKLAVVNRFLATFT
jgi:hypothetical protein